MFWVGEKRQTYIVRGHVPRHPLLCILFIVVGVCLVQLLCVGLVCALASACLWPRLPLT